MRIAILCGGISPERDVSLRTAVSVQGALIELGNCAEILDWPESAVVERYDELRGYDLVFVGYHGGAGEDGRVQSVLELLGIRYTGSGPSACAVSMDKIFSKRFFEQAGIPTPEWAVWERPQAPTVDEVVSLCGFGFPIVVKTPNGGSTVGISIANDRDELSAGIDVARGFEDRILFERFIPGRELTVAVLGGEGLPVVEIVPSGGFYDYQHKYTSGASEYICPADISGETARRLIDCGKRAFEVLGLRHYGRVDFRLDGESLYCLEANSLPGMTSLSLVPKAAAAVGISFVELIQRIIHMAGGK